MSPYFDGCYFDPAYFDAAPCGGSGGGHPRRWTIPVVTPPSDDDLVLALLEAEDGY